MGSRSRIAGLALAIGLVGLFLAVPAFPLALAPAERITNGSFEAGFDEAGLASGWRAFDSGGGASYSWGDESREPLLWDGAHGQSISIAALNPMDGGHSAGIFQTLAVAPGQTYQLVLRGLLQVEGGAAIPPPAGCRARWAAAHGRQVGWWEVRDWVDLPWPVTPAGTPGPLNVYITSFTARSDRLTLFILLERWGRAASGCRLTLDALSLKRVGPAAAGEVGGFHGPAVTLTAPAFPSAGRPATGRASASSEGGVRELRLYEDGVEVGRVTRSPGGLSLEAEFDWTPAGSGIHTLRAEAIGTNGAVGIAAGTVTVGETAEFIANGGFEAGFGSDGVGRAWEAFGGGNGGRREWSAESRPAAVLRGRAAQTIHSSAPDAVVAGKGLDGETYAGVYQVIEGLRPGATYWLALWGWPRVAGGVLDADGVSVEYALAWGEDAESGGILDWNRLPWRWTVGEASPAGYQAHRAPVVAQSARATLFIRGRRAGSAPAAGFSLSLDEVSLSGYR